MRLFPIMASEGLKRSPRDFQYDAAIHS